MKKEDGVFLKQLADSLQKTIPKIEQAYENRDYDNFARLKKFILEIENKIGEATK